MTPLRISEASCWAERSDICFFCTFVKLHTAFSSSTSPLNLQKLHSNHTFNNSNVSHAQRENWIKLGLTLCQLLQQWTVSMMKRAMTSCWRKDGTGPSPQARRPGPLQTLLPDGTPGCQCALLKEYVTFTAFVSDDIIKQSVMSSFVSVSSSFQETTHPSIYGTSQSILPLLIRKQTGNLPHNLDHTTDFLPKKKNWCSTSQI